MAKRIGTNIVLCHLVEGHKYEQFANSKSCEFDIKRDMQEVASPTSGQAKEYIPGRYSWTMSCKCLLADDNSVVWNYFKDGTEITVAWEDITTDSNTHEMLSGSAIIKELHAGAQIHDMATLQISLQGTGEIKRTTI